ncbi:MAG: EAL domain-containing protein [Proteobacteria bacterium]|nr:EAL domain-containing protein [Pseudomonadota bacterium]
MKLGYYLLLAVSGLFAVLLAGVGYMSVSGTRDYLEHQLGAHAEETATSLALAIGSAANPDDTVLLATIVNPVFDRGQYERIQIIGISGAVLVNRKLQPADPDVPEWFQRLFPIESPGGEALISAGWRQIGRVTVLSRPALAYAHLWQSGIETLAWLFALYLVALVALRAMLVLLLRTLTAIESAAHDIGERKFRTITIKPWAREFKSVVAAFNQLSRKIRLVIDEEMARAEQFRREAFTDALTGLPNRRGLDLQIQRILEPGAIEKFGVFAMIEIHGLADFNEKNGFQKTDEFLRHFSAVLSAAGEPPDFVCGRLNGATFAALLTSTDAAWAAATLSGVFHQLQAALEQAGAGGSAMVQVGAVQFDDLDQSFHSLLAAADLALARAGRDGRSALEIVPLTETDTDTSARGSVEWRRLIEQALAARQLTLFAQTVVSLPAKRMLHTEINVRLQESAGQTVPARLFVPMALRHKLGPRLDAVVLDLALEHLTREQGGASAAGVIALNICGASLCDTAFLAHLAARLSAAPALAKRLVFETTEAAFLENVEAVLVFAARVRALGAQFALDNFMVSGESLKRMESLLPHYLKLSASLTVDLFKSAEARFLVSSLVRIAQSLEIAVIAQGIEEEQSIDVLTRLGVSGVQGYAVGRPEPW